MNRELGASEQLLWLLAQTKPINVVLCATITGALSIKQLNAALAEVQHRHPLLGVKISSDRSQPRFVSENVRSIPLRVIERQGEEHWCQEVEAELLRPFSSSEDPLIRAVLLYSSDVSELIVTFDHCIGDGLSGAYLIRDILNLASQPNIMQRLPEPRSCEELIPVSAGVLNTDAVDEDLQSFKTAKLNLAALQNRTSDKEIQKQPGLLHWSLSPEETDSLVSCCRKEQTSVHGALCASFLLSIAQEASLTDGVVLKCMSPLSLRNHLVPPIGEDFGAYYTRELTYHKIEPGRGFWEVAREAKHQLNRVLTDGKIYAGILKVSAFLSTKPDAIALRQYTNDLIGSELTVTNLGRLNISEQFGLLQMRQLYLTVAGIAPIIVGAATLGGKMFVTVRYLKTAIPSAAAVRINQGAMQRLREAVSFSQSQKN
ncbi:MAG TPA: hypothetical protein DEV81_20400 [Cyanobacteria bacterium UBA11049]|nr:hypothetical protein [Cyanobacteria bacterium UBA11049]